MKHSAVCSYHVQSRIMHNVTVQLLTAGSQKIIYSWFYGHEELIFEVVPNEILLGPNSILRECAGSLRCIRCIFIMPNPDLFKLHMWPGVPPCHRKVRFSQWGKCLLKCLNLPSSLFGNYPYHLYQLPKDTWGLMNKVSFSFVQLNF